MTALTQDASLTADERACADLRRRGWRPDQIARHLGVDREIVREHLFAARKKGALQDTAALLDHLAVPLAIDNVIEQLMAGDVPTSLEVLKGRGHLRQHTRQDGTAGGPTMMALQLKIEMPAGASVVEPDALIGQVVGVPRVVAAAADTE